MKILSYKFITPDGGLDISGMTPRLALSVLYSLDGVSLEYSIVEGKPITIESLREYLFNVKKHYANEDTSEYTVDTLVELIVEETNKLPPFGGINLTAYVKYNARKPEKIATKHISLTSKCPLDKVGKRLTLDLLDLTKDICGYIHIGTSTQALEESMFTINQCSSVTKDLYSVITERKRLASPKFELSDKYFIDVEFL